jgi:glutaminase
MKDILERILKEVEPLKAQGSVADYIPELSKVDPNKFAMAVVDCDGNEYVVGDAYESFSIQSISKLFILMLAMQMHEEDFKRVGVEPSGNAFNSLVQLEHENGIPRNPFINAGALVVTDTLMTQVKDAKDAILDFVRGEAGSNKVNFNLKVAQSEIETGDRNFALAHFMKSFGNIESDIDELLDVYCTHCSLEMSCLELARSGMVLANHGLSPYSKKRILTKKQAQRAIAIMMTCGTYDNVGEFAYRVGLPAKSGVGGGILAILPGELSVAVWSPTLNKYGNSIAGMKALELFTNYTDKSIF